MKAGCLENDKIYGRDCRGGRAVCRGSRRKCANHTGDTGKDNAFNNNASMDTAIHSDKASAGMAGKIVILLLVDIYGQLKKLNERQGKEDAGNND